MATSVQRATETPAALAGVVVGTFYAIQNTGLVDVRLSVGPSGTAPDTAGGGFLLRSGLSLAASAGTGEAIWVWGVGGYADLAYEASE